MVTDVNGAQIAHWNTTLLMYLITRRGVLVGPGRQCWQQLAAPRSADRSAQPAILQRVPGALSHRTMPTTSVRRAVVNSTRIRRLGPPYQIARRSVCSHRAFLQDTTPGRTVAGRPWSHAGCPTCTRPDERRPIPLRLHRHDRTTPGIQTTVEWRAAPSDPVRDDAARCRPGDEPASPGRCGHCRSIRRHRGSTRIAGGSTQSAL